MKLDLTLSMQQLAGKLPFYIKGRKFWLVSEKQHNDLIMLKAKARATSERLQKLVNLTLERRKT